MSPLTRPVRQGLATAAVVLFTVAPTAYVAHLSWRVNRLDHVRQVEAELSHRLGLFVALEGVSYPRPGTIVYRRPVLRLEETGKKDSRREEIARAEAIRLTTAGRELTLNADGLRLKGHSPRAAMTQVAALLRRVGAARDFDRINVVARSCRIDLGNGLAYSTRDVAATLQADGPGPSFNVGYRLVGEDGQGPRCELTLTRDRSADPARTLLSLKTVDAAPLPASVLDAFFGTPAVEYLGSTAKLDGELVLKQQGTTDWEAEFRGDLLDIDLAALVANLAPDHRMSGRGRVSVARAVWGDRPGRGSGWVEARGVLLGTQGTIGTPLLEALRSDLRFQVDGRYDAGRTEVEYQQLGLGFAIDRKGEIRLTGALPAEYLPGAVIVQSQRVKPLLRAPEGTATVPGLLRVLVAAGDSNPDLLVPGTSESQSLQRYLPAPSVKALPTSRSLKAN